MTKRENTSSGFKDAFENVKASTNLALYRKYRSRTLDEIIGQPQVTDVLKSAAATKNYAHAYLLTGQRGTGKTSVARILAHLINETPYDTNEKDADLDIIEIDAASRGSVDDARELREKSAIAPIRAPHKIYIIDEVHMLSTAAFNALLKIIEEPPEHIVFILATTELQKVPATILSRVQRFHFRPVPAEIVAKHLRQISDSEKIATDDEALLLISQRGGGSLRDAISLLDQLSGTTGSITRQTVEEILGLAPETEINKIIDNLKSESAEDSVEIVKTLQKLFADGISASLIVNQLIDVLENLAPSDPELYELIERLLDVAKSAAPDVKLTAILMQFATRNLNRSRKVTSTSDKVVAQIATATREEEKLAQIIERNIAEERAEQITESVVATSAKPNPRATLSGGESVREDTRDDGLAERREDYGLAELAQKNVIKIPQQASDNSDLQVQEKSPIYNKNLPTEISWPDILDQIQKSDQPTILATAKFAEHTYENDQITLYFAKAFHRKKAETAKFRTAVAEAIRNLYDSDIEIIIAKTPVPENSDAAKILDIMGGGEVMRDGKA
ncbi:DNA polymerase III subunit gamma/tau [Candidatus Saccharibacteria bacterium]|nr:DNA polymerase III subunit gamma/tau [Candidatus Saccharibacteria bacterium]